jgi:hypothetical protein
MKLTPFQCPFIMAATIGLLVGFKVLGQDQPPEGKAEPSATHSAQVPQQSRLKKQTELPKELVEVNERLREACREFCPSARMRYNDGERQITVEDRTRDFQVYSVFKDGRVAEQLHVERGPKHDGFLLQVTLQPGRYQGAAEIPQDIRHPYWTTYVNAIELPDKESHLHVQLSYGSRTDRELLDRLKEVVGIRMPARND